MLAGFAMLGVIFFIKKDYKSIIPILVFYLVSIALFLPVNSDAGGLIFSGFWRFEDFVVQPSIGLSYLELARRVYLDHNNFLKVFLYDLYFSLLYIVFSMGILLLSLFQTKKSLKLIPKYLTIALAAGLLTTCIAGFFFIQKIGGANSSQFLISIYLICTIYTAIVIVSLLKRLPKKLSLALGMLLIALGSTRVIHDTSTRIMNISNRIGIFIDNEILESYKYFSKTKTDDIILTYKEDSLDCHFIRTISKSSLYVCGISIGAPEDDGAGFRERVAIKKLIFHGENIRKSEELLKSNNISYIYMPKAELNMSNIGKMDVLKIYENNKTLIYKMNDR
jgi:hypothetical protein